HSPAIDRGDDRDLPLNEPAPNGRFVDLGAYGNTAQASQSPAEYMLVTRPDGGETWPGKQTFPIRWRTQDNGGATALAFDGVDDDVHVADAPSLRVQDLTLEGWVNFSDLSGVRVLFGKTLGTASLDSYVVWYQDNSLRATISDT